MNKDIQQMHLTNVRLFSQYRVLESKLMDALQAFDENKGYLKMGRRSLYEYCVETLGMSEGQAYTLIRVSRKAKECPELKRALENQEITTSKARVIVPLLDKDNHENNADWLDKAKNLPKASLEKEVARVNPKAAKPDRISPINEKQSIGEFVLSDKAKEILQRVQELEAKRTSSKCDADAAIIAMGEAYLVKHDPVEKAKRAEKKRSVSKLTSPRIKNPFRSRKIPSEVLHQVYLRDQGCCRAQGCGTRHFTQIHHIQPFARGGAHRLDNLVTLCSGHHSAIHFGTPLTLSLEPVHALDSLELRCA